MKVCNNKDCAHGGKPQPMVNFSIQKQNRDGRKGSCKDCERERNHEKYNSRNGRNGWMNMVIG